MAEKSPLALFEEKLEEAFRIINADATDEEWAKAKNATICLCYRFVEREEEDDEDGVEEGEEVDGDAVEEGEEEDEEASSEEVSEAEKKVLADIKLLYGKQRYLLSRELSACQRRIKEHNERIAHFSKNNLGDVLSPLEAKEVISSHEAQRQKQNEVVVSLRDRFCAFQQQIVDLDEQLVDSLRADVPKDCRDATPCDCLSGNTICLTDDEKAFEIDETIKTWTKYYQAQPLDDEDDDDGPPPAKKVKTGAKSPFIEAMQNQTPILVEHSTGGDHQWHQAKILENEGKSMYTVKYLELTDEGKEEVEHNVPVKRLALNGPGLWNGVLWGDERRAKYKRAF